METQTKTRNNPLCPRRDTTVNQKCGRKPNPREGVEFGIGRQNLFKSILIAHGRTVHSAPYRSPFDFLVDDGLRIELKSARMQLRVGKPPYWFFNIHRHGKLNESTTDWYVLRLEGIPFHANAIHLAVRSPIGHPTVLLSIRSLIRGCAAQGIADFERLCCGELSLRQSVKQ